MNNRFSRIVCGFLSVVMCIFSTANVVNIKAEDIQIVPEYEDAITVNALSVALKRGDGSFAEINEWTQVNNGDKLSLDFEWTAKNNEQPPLTFVYDLSDALQNISLGNQQIDTADATYRIVDQTLYIDIAKGKQGRSGTCRLEGIVDLSNATVDERGVTVLEFLDKSVYAYAPGKVTGVLVEKSAGEFVKEGNEYYQYFTIRVKNKSTDNSVKGATLTDTFASDDNLYANSTLVGYTIKNSDNSVHFGPSDINSGVVTALPEIAAGDYVTVTYKVKVDKEAALNKKNGENVATVGYSSAGDSKTAEGHAWSNADIPVVSKTGYLDQNTKDKITYTITIDPGTLVSDSGNFVIVDTPDGISANIIADAINQNVAEDSNKAVASNGAVNIPVGALNTSNGVYTLTYTVDLPDNFKNQIINKNVKNTVSATFDGQYEYTSTADIYIPANGSALVNKSVESYDYATGIINWKVELFIPNDDSETNKLASYEFSDWLNGDVSGALGEKGKSYFDDNGATDAVDKSKAVISGLKVNGQTVDNTIATYDVWNTNSSNISKLTFTEKFLDDHAGETVTLTYSSKMDTSVDGHENLVYTNTSQISFSYENGSSQYLQAHAYVSPSFYTNKKAIHASTTTNNAVKWSVVLKSHTYNFTLGETITVKETLPAGYRIISDKYGIATENWEPEAWNTDYSNLVSYTASVDEDTDVQTVIFTITVDERLKARIDRTGEYNNYLAVVFEASMTDEYYNKFNLEKATGVPVDITNKAAVTINNKDYNVSCTSQVTPVVPDGVLSKDVVSNKLTNSEGKETGKFEAEYTIVVNENADDLIENSDDLVLTDTLGTWLELDESSIVVNPQIDLSDVSYNNSTRTITFNLRDKTKYIINYKVTGDCAKFKTLDSDESGIDRSEAQAMFSNTVTLKGQNISGISTSEMLDVSTYETNATYKYDVLLSGEKSWSDETDTAVIPKTVTINLKETKTSPSGVVTVTPSKQTLEVKNTDGSWSYNIENLVSKDAEGNRYIYEIVEVNVGGDTIENSGFTVTYADATSTETDDGEEIIINFKNDFTADDIEKGKIVVNKVWDDNNNANRPSVKFVLKNTTTNETWEETLGNDTSVTFEGLPLYAYSRDAQDKLVRTPYEYTISELTVNGEEVQDYTVEYEESNIIIASANDIPANENEQPVKTVTVTNTYEAPIPQETASIKVTKVWNDDNNTISIPHPDEITVALLADGEDTGKTAILTDSSLTAVFDNLNVYKNENGVKTKIKYSVAEVNVDGYTTTYSVDNGAAASECEEFELVTDTQTDVTVTNTFKHTIEYGSISVIKKWVDANSDPIESQHDIEITLSDSVGSAPRTATISKNDANATAEFTNLPLKKYERLDDGSLRITDITYTVSEEAIDGFTASYTLDGNELNGPIVLTAGGTSNLTITNMQEPAGQISGSVNVKKLWAGDNAYANAIRPASVEFTVTNTFTGETVTRYTDGEGNCTFTGLPVFKTNGNVVTDEKITYKITEKTVTGYVTTYSAVIDENNSFVFDAANPEFELTVTNTFTPDVGSITVNKVWQDENGGTLPENEKVEILVTLSDTVDGNSDQSKNITTAESSVTFDDLPVYESYERQNGVVVGVNPITYFVTETTVSGFETTYSVSPLDGISFENSSTGVVTITNKKKAEALGSIKVTKNWNDAANTEGIAHPAITVVLKADGVQTATKTIAATESTATFENLSVYKPDGTTPIQYSVVEQTAIGYNTVSYSPTGSFVISENGVTDVTITNTFDYELKKGHISVKKEWVDSDGSDLAINDTITVEIKAGNTLVASGTITGSGTKTFSDLPLYTYTRNNDGSISENDIFYTVTETSAASGYNVSYTLDGAALEGGFKLKASDTRAVVIQNKKIAVVTPDISESQSSQSTTPSGGSGGNVDSDDNGDSAETPTQSVTDTPTQSGSEAPSQSDSEAPSQSDSEAPSQSVTDTPTQSGSGTRPSYTTPSPSYVQTTTTVKNTTTTTAADGTKNDGTTAPDEEPEETTVVDEDTDTTKPAEPDDYEEDDSEDAEDSEDYEPDDSEDADDSDDHDETDESEDDEDEMQDEDGDIDDYIGEDTDFETNIEENPHTSITINTGYVLSFAFGAYAFFPRKKKKK